jgi:hypothetical protein
MDLVLNLLDRPIAFHRCLVEPAGSVNAALMLSQALYWSKRTKDPHGWFYKTRDEWEEETGLSRWEQESARKLLRASGFWFEQLRGVPATTHYRVGLNKLYLQLVGKPPTGRVENLQQDSGKTSNITSSETTTETTQKENITYSGHDFSPPGFQKFWEAYPYKRDSDPREARNAWFRSGFAEREAETVLAGLELWKASEEWQDQRLVPSPEKFIRGRRWETFPPKRKATKHEKTAAAVKRFLEGTDSEVAPEVGKAFQH